MNAKIAGVIGFVVGALAGAGTTYYILKKYTDKRIEDEVNEVVDYYRNKSEAEVSEKEETKAEEPKKDIPEDKPTRNVKMNNTPVEPDYDEIIEKLNYSKYSTTVDNSAEPYIISADEYHAGGALQEKKQVSWFLDDEVLCDAETDEVIHDVDKNVGFGNLELFGKSDGATEDELYVRNDKLGIDYYIVLETGSYADYIASIEG